MNKLHIIKEFGCPYSVIKCKNCKWNYADTCNFDFDSYQQGRADATRWIPCSERLPEENGYYITTTQYNEVYCDYFDGEKFSRTEFVIAWMYLPEPYVEEQKK